MLIDATFLQGDHMLQICYATFLNITYFYILYGLINVLQDHFVLTIFFIGTTVLIVIN